MSYIRYVKAGADALFPEAITRLEDYKTFAQEFPNTPILSNMTEFGKTPLIPESELGPAGVSMVRGL